jgi:hypothetical protein
MEVGGDVKINSIFPDTRNSFHGLPTLRVSNVLDETLQLAVWTGLLWGLCDVGADLQKRGSCEGIGAFSFLGKD